LDVGRDGNSTRRHIDRRELGQNGLKTGGKCRRYEQQADPSTAPLAMKLREGSAQDDNFYLIQFPWGRGGWELERWRNGEGGVFLMRYLLAECCGGGVGGPL
jgi:hypothetical protein